MEDREASLALVAFLASILVLGYFSYQLLLLVNATSNLSVLLD